MRIKKTNGVSAYQQHSLKKLTVEKETNVKKGPKKLSVRILRFNAKINYAIHYFGKTMKRQQYDESNFNGCPTVAKIYRISVIIGPIFSFVCVIEGPCPIETLNCIHLRCSSMGELGGQKRKVKKG